MLNNIIKYNINVNCIPSKWKLYVLCDICGKANILSADAIDISYRQDMKDIKEMAI